MTLLHSYLQEFIGLLYVLIFCNPHVQTLDKFMPFSGC